MSVDAKQCWNEPPPAAIEEAHCPRAAVHERRPAHRLHGPHLDHDQTQLHFSDDAGRLDHLMVVDLPASEVSHLAAEV